VLYLTLYVYVSFLITYIYVGLDLYIHTYPHTHYNVHTYLPLYAYSHMYGCDYTGVFDWWPDLLDSLIQHVTTLYSSLLHTHIPVFTVTSSMLLLGSGFNGLRSPSSGFPNCPRAQLPASKSSSSQRLSLNSSPTKLLTHSSLTDSTNWTQKPTQVTATPNLSCL
jgi:hypothetical protein